MIGFKKKVWGIFSIALAVVLIIGCTPGTENTMTDLSKDTAITENTMPISEEGITLSVWGVNGSQGYAKSYNDFEAFKSIADITGVNLDFTHPTGAAREQFNIILASGDYPDIMYYYFARNAATLKAYDEGTFVPLTELVNKYAPNMKKVIESSENYNLGEEILLLPCFRDDARFLAYDGYFIRQDWLDKVGLSIPETIQDWETVLRAFRDNDLNGNGDKDDETPFATAQAGDMFADVFAGGFGMASYGYFISPHTNEMTHSLLEPGFKDYMTTMARWYNEGFLNKNFFSTTIPQLDSMMLNDELASIYIDNNNDVPKYMQANPELDLVAVPYVKEKDGNIYHPKLSGASLAGSLGAVITSSCKNVKEAVRFFDYLYTKEASDLMYWGKLGESYTVDDNGNYQFTDLILNNPDGKTPYEAICKYMTNTGFVGMHQYESMVGLESNLPERVQKVKNQSVEYSMQADKSLVFVNKSSNKEEIEEMNVIDTDLGSYLSEMFQKFIMGYEPIENLDNFIQRAKDLGLERAVEIRQQAYARQKNTN